MNRLLLRNAPLYARRLLRSAAAVKVTPDPPIVAPLADWTLPRVRFFSSDNDSGAGAPPNAPETELVQAEDKEAVIGVPDVSNQELKMRIEKYFKGDEEALPSVVEAILQRRITGEHEETDDELIDELDEKPPIDDVDDEDIESDFEDMHSTDEEIEDLYSARDIVEQRMGKDPYFNMDDKKWDEMIEEAVKHKLLQDTRECEETLEDMLKWDKLLPDDMKKEVEEKFNELGDLCEKGELEPEEAFEQFKQFEDEMLFKYAEVMEAQAPPDFSDAVPDNKKDLDDPPGEGPILRWHTRVVFAPGGDAWHPKNRKVKMGVTVKELGLSKHQFRRLRELVGKRYHPGRDELMITSERFEHREENRKDCLRTLLSLIEEAGKANKLVEYARTSYVKDRLRRNPAFMQRLQAKTLSMKASSSAALA